MNIHLKGFDRSSGFTLIEMAIVLVIVMTVLTLGLSALSSVVSSSAISETKARQARIKDALIAYLGVHKRLPCPDVHNTFAGVTGYETIASGVCISNFGVVPYTTLGLGREVAEDGWQNYFSYQVTGSASDCNPPYNSTDNNWTSASCFGAAKSGLFWVYDGSLQLGAPQPTGLAFYNSGTPISDLRAVVVLISHGPNGLGAWTRQGTRNALPPDTKCEEKMNADRASLVGGCTLPAPTLPASIPAPSNVNTFIAGGRQGNDDVVSYLTAGDMIQALSKQGVIKSAPAKVQNDFDRLGAEVIVLKLNRYVTGPPSSCTTSIFASSFPEPRGDPLDNLDPWGMPYQDQAIENTSAANRFPICVCSTGGIAVTRVGNTLFKSPVNSVLVVTIAGNACQVPPITSDGFPNPTVCREITNLEFNGYLTKAGKAPC